MVRFVWSGHAQRQLDERRISRQIILSAFRKPDRIIRQTTKRWRVMKVIHRNRRKYLLIVIYDQANHVREIVTAFMTSKLDKYI